MEIIDQKTAMKDISFLMIPRVEVIAYYPGSIFKIGEILQLKTESRNSFPVQDYYVKETGRGVLASEVEKATVCFRPMAWHEKRAIEDMPEYVKYESNGIIHECEKVIGWDENYAIFEYYPNSNKPKRAARLEDKCLLPATRAEYVLWK
jgi:hypothetical protein